MNDSELNLFGDESEVVLPRVENYREKDYLDVESAISGETVKSVVLPMEESLIQPNYVIDLTNITEIEPIQANALDALLDEDGDIGVYIYIQGGIQRIGMGDSSILDRLIALAIRETFGDKCRVFKNYRLGEEPVIFRAKDITKLRLSI